MKTLQTEVIESRLARLKLTKNILIKERANAEYSSVKSKLTREINKINNLMIELELILLEFKANDIY
ncbi:MAG: hypothetical protein WBL58_04340 [Peptococcia bacterium]